MNERIKKNAKKIIFDMNETKENRIQASFALMNDGSDEAVDCLIKALFSEPSPIVRHEIAFSLGETASPKAVPNLIKVMETDDNIFVVHEAALALATLGDRRAEEPLKKLLNHEHPDVAESAEIALQRLLSNET